jgi:ankyrin repeat protein
LDLGSNEAVGTVAAEAIRRGDLEALERLLDENRELAAARIDGSRTLLHVATDWPGHFPNGPATVAMLIAHGADVNARFVGAHHSETPLHWAASSDDVDVLDRLLDAGADIEAPGSVIDGGPPLADAVAFGQWRSARRLVERGARTTLWQAAGLGLLERVRQHLPQENAGRRESPEPAEVTSAFWCACHGGQRESAEFLLDHGADLNWIGYDGLTPLDAARRSGAVEFAAWLQDRGARSARELR